MCCVAPSQIAEAIAAAVRVSSDPITTQQIGDALLLQGVCRFHTLRSFPAACASGAILPKDKTESASPWTNPGVQWVPAPVGGQDKFEILVPGRWAVSREELGRGGNSIVRRGQQLGLVERPVAIKLLPPQLVRITEGHSDEWKQIVREIKVLARLSHPNIITVFDGGIIPSTKAPYIAMELVEWPTLFTLVRQRGPLPPLLAVRILRGAAAGLAYALSRSGLFHRDLKPANLFVDADLALVKVGDFGLAYFDEGSVSGDGTSTTRGQPSLLGTPGFHAPERYRWAKGDHRSDYYSLGITGYWALTGGQFPFANFREGETPISDWVHAHENVDSMAIDIRDKSRAPGCPLDLARFIHRLIRRNPEERPQSYPDLIRDLDRLIRDLEPGTTRMAPTTRVSASPIAAPAGDSEISHFINQDLPPTEKAGAVPGASRLIQDDPAFVEALAALAKRTEAAERRYEDLFGPDALYFPQQPVLKALTDLAARKGVLAVYRAITEMDAEKSFPDFENLYRRQVAGEEEIAGAPFTTIAPSRFFYDAHSLALHALDAESAAKAKELAEKVVRFLEDSLAAPEILQLRRGCDSDGSKGVEGGAEVSSQELLPPAPSPVNPAGAPDFGPGTRIQNLLIRRELGRGGYGTVYLAYDESLDRDVAVKTLTPSPDPKLQEENRRFFEREQKIASRLRHPNVVQVHSTFLHGNTPCLVMEYVEGTSLALRLRAIQKYPAIDALEIVRQVAEGLAHAHEAGLVHRDIKPDNVLLELGGRAVITDFGLMKSIRVADDGAGSSATKPLTFLGSPHYSSPEQARAEAVDRRSDIYSLGATLYELLSGVRPFVGETEMAVLHQIASLDVLPRPLTVHVPGIDSEIVILIDQMLAKRPEERFQSCEDVIAAIDKILTRLHRQPKGKSASSGRRMLLAAGAAAALIAGLIAFWPQPKSETPVAKTFLPPRPPEHLTEIHEEKAVEPKPVEKEAPKPAPTPVDPPKRPDQPTPKTDSPEFILTHHSPTKEELELLEKLLALGRRTLSERSAYRFSDSLSQVTAFHKEHESSLGPWLTLIVQAGRENLMAAAKAFASRPFFKRDEPLSIVVLRNGTTLRGKVVAEEGEEISIDPTAGFRTTLKLSAVAPTTFSSAAVAPLEGIQVRVGAGDAAGSLGKIGELGETDRLRILPLVLDQAIEEALQAAYREKDLVRLLALDIPDAYQAAAAKLIPTRYRLLLVEQEAARLYRKKADKDAAKRLLTDLSPTCAGGLFAKDTLEEFRKGLAQGAETADLEHGPVWESAFSTPDRCSFDWKGKESYTIKAPESNDWTWIRRDHNGARAGYSVHWSFGDGEGAHLWIAPYTLEKGIRIEVSRADVVLSQFVTEGGNPKEVVLKKVDLPSPIGEGNISVVPREGAPLLYLGDRFLFELPEIGNGLPGQMWVGCSGGTVILKSVRVVDRKAY